MKRVIIEVTQDDINRGDRHNSRKCAFARALRRTLGRAWAVGYDGLFLRAEAFADELPLTMVTRIPVLDHFPISKALAEFVLRFDKGLTVKPHRFAIDVPA